MTAKEYLSQAYRLDQRINSNIAVMGRKGADFPQYGSPLCTEP